MSQPEWNASEYQKYRPTYDPATFDRIAAYHSPGAFGHALEIGCGTGLASQSIAPRFDRLTAIDPSTEMLQEARKLHSIKTRSGQPVDFREGGAESLDFLDDASVDLICAATAAHWFPDDWWTGAKRVLVNGGTVALFTYGGYAISTGEEPEPKGVEDVNHLTQYLLNDDVFEPKAGNKVVTTLYDTLPMPKDSGWSETQRPKWTFVQKDRTMSFEQFWALVMTASHLRRYRDVHPDFTQPGNPLEDTRQKMQKAWPTDKTCYMALPMVIVFLKKLA